MSEPYTYNPSPEENRNIFTASCVESVASALQQSADEIYNVAEQYNELFLNDNELEELW